MVLRLHLEGTLKCEHWKAKDDLGHVPRHRKKLRKLAVLDLSNLLPPRSMAILNPAVSILGFNCEIVVIGDPRPAECPL